MRRAAIREPIREAVTHEHARSGSSRRTPIPDAVYVCCYKKLHCYIIQVDRAALADCTGPLPGSWYGGCRCLRSPAITV
jgi:hypothetical protein